MTNGRHEELRLGTDATILPRMAANKQRQEAGKFEVSLRISNSDRSFGAHLARMRGDGRWEVGGKGRKLLTWQHQPLILYANQRLVRESSTLSLNQI
jgi:hypothetical protein